MYRFGDCIEERARYSFEKTWQGRVTGVSEKEIVYRPFGDHHERRTEISRVKPITVKPLPTRLSKAQQEALVWFYRGHIQGYPVRLANYHAEVSKVTVLALDRWQLIEPITVDEPGGWKSYRWQLTAAGATLAQPLYGYPGWYDLWAAIDAYYRQCVAWMKDLPTALAIQRYGMSCPDAEIKVHDTYAGEIYYTADVGDRRVHVFRQDSHYRIKLNLDSNWQGEAAEDVQQYANWLDQAARLCRQWNAEVGDAAL